MEMLNSLTHAEVLIQSAHPDPLRWSGPAASALIAQLEAQIRQIESIRSQLWLI